MLMYNLLEYRDNYLKTSGSLFKYFTDKQALCNIGAIGDFTYNITTDLFKFQENITSQICNDVTKNVEIIVPLRYLSNLWRTLEMS